MRSITQGAPPFVGLLPPLDLVASRPGLADLALLRFYDPSHFRAGNIHGISYVWQNLIPNSPCGEVDLLEIIREGVRVEHFFRPFRGIFRGMSFPTTSRRPSTTRMIISTCFCIPRLRLILVFSGRVFISSSVLFHSVGRPVRLFITSSVSRFQTPLGPLVFQSRNTLTTGTWASFSPLPFG